MITVTNLSKHYGLNTVLENINLTFSKGKVYGIVGANGAGKTTLFRCIAGLEEDYDGEVESHNKPLKNHLGLLLTEPFFFKRLTGREYITLLCNARNKAVENISAMNIFDLPLEQYASTYSTGMKKKLALTAILMQENDYFILDEPFNGVDIQSNLILIALILKLKSLNKVILVSSHIFSTLSEICDEIHLLKGGGIAKTVQPDNFEVLEQEMKTMVLGSRIEQLDLR